MYYLDECEGSLLLALATLVIWRAFCEPSQLRSAKMTLVSFFFSFSFSFIPFVLLAFFNYLCHAFQISSNLSHSHFKVYSERLAFRSFQLASATERLLGSKRLLFCKFVSFFSRS